MTGTRLMVVAALALSAMVVLGATACSTGGMSTQPTPVTTFMITPSSLGPATEPPVPPTVAAGATAVPTAAPTSAATTAASPEATTQATATSGGDTGTKIVIIAKNLLFDKTSLTAPAGKITIVLENQDPGQPHNIHFYKGTDVTGESVGMTELHVGPATDTLTMTLSKGVYFYQCDVHPTTMYGTLTVT